MRFRRIIIGLFSTGALCAWGSPDAFGQAGIQPYEIERVGQSGWQFLKINPDPRQEAMGGAYTALSRGDANAVFGNPAALTNVSGTDVQANSILWLADINHQSLSVAHNFGDFGVVALSFATLDYGDIEETINSPIPGETRTEALITGNTYTARDLVAGLTYARRVTENLSIGASFRWMREGIAELSMTNWSFDFGTVFYTGFRTLRIAVAARNFGPDSRLVGWSEQYQSESFDVRMPLDFRVGVAMDFFDSPDSPHLLVATVDGDHPNDGPEKFHFGAEYSFQKTFFLRGGYKFNYDEQGLTLGAGVLAPIAGLSLNVNYAFVDFGALQQVHMFSLGIAL